MLMVGIAGGTGSGKTTVAEAIVDALGADNVGLISQDAYYKDLTNLTLEERRQRNFDHPDAFDTDLLLEHLTALRNGQTVYLPVYDFARHTRAGVTVPMASKPVIVLEGIHVLVDERVRSLLDIKVFVHTDADVRVLRRLARDIQERGRTLDSVLTQYLSTVKPMHDAFIEPSKRYADLIIPEGGENKIAISLLTTRIAQFLLETAGRVQVGPKAL
ncbi:uridine kinase [Alicyclobacillus cycloheptanicus]|uniref:Uridine kinase n=1 Tax=Alicyclobacillus cycloheptanicus TaxID=1457 RepID=A0ABT9XKR5_9BACL|nr:uridine kinase [Alicyclobacillus cycloheptanicus]MDQ0190898.1 uridine kinase [Alicyclobacillus cycloheptanicus]WDM01784.1 uridine kinase [Alicyclobacillus cycloheptanicus]